MKVIILDLNGTKYTTGKITAYLSKEALKIQKNTLELAKKGKNLQDNTEDYEAIEGLIEDAEVLHDSKVNLICELYGNKFTADMLEKTLSDEEIEEQINNIVSGIYGIVSKN